MDLVQGDDGRARCWWGAGPEIYRDYHDHEWGRPKTADHLLLEKLCLEGFQAGLSWLTILRKRENFRQSFAGFDPERLHRFTDRDVERLLADPGIVRHQGKIRSAINNAARALELMEEHGSLGAYFWAGAEPDRAPPRPLPSSTEASTALSKDLKRRGWSFVGPTTVYAFMQAIGLVNDHVEGCHLRPVCSAARSDLVAGL